MQDNIINSKNTLSKEEQLSLFKEYRKTLNIDIRNKLIEANLGLVLKLSNFYSKDDLYEKEEIISFAYEGLILAVENYNPSLHVDFVTFACEYIKYKILAYLPNLSGFKRGKFFTDFMKIRKLVEQEKCEKLINNLDMVDEILNSMIENDMINKSQYIKYRNKILINLPIGLNDYNYKEFEVDENFLSNIELQELKNNIEELFSVLTSEEEIIIKLSFGFYDELPKSPIEIAKFLEISVNEVYYIKKVALNKIKRIVFRKKINLTIPSNFNLDKYENLDIKIIRL